MKKVKITLKNRFTNLNEELFLLEDKTIVNQKTLEVIIEQNYFVPFEEMVKCYESNFGTKSIKK